MKRLGELAKHSPRHLAIAGLRDVGIERCFAPLPVPRPSDEIAHVDRAMVESWRQDGWPNGSDAVAAEWHQYLCDRSTAIASNVARLRLAMWNVTALEACLAADPSDKEASEHLEDLRGYLGAAWGLTSFPADYSERHALAERMVRRKLEAMR